MKAKTISYFITIGLMAQFLVIATSSAPISLSGVNGLDYNYGATMIQEADMTEFSQPPADYPLVEGYWTDLVNTEKVANDGANVYVAVLDTGLLSNWQSLFPYANIATELGMGFSHDFYWDYSVDDVMVGPLLEDRGFITDLASGHGTHVTSTIVGFDIYGSYGVNGVAPEVTIIPVLVLDAWLVDSPYGTLGFSGGTSEMISAGIMYIADLADSLDGPVVINMSLGGGYSPSIEAAVDYAISQGVIVVASAGNNGEAGMGYPGALPQIISAASVGWTGTWYYGWQADTPENLYETDFLGNNHQLYLSDFSSRPNMQLGQNHQALDVAAPGSWIVGPYKSAFANNFGYYYLSGTSMAAPHVTGMIALILQSFPDLTQSEVEFIVKNAARGNPLPADGTWDYSPFASDPFIFHSWKGGDYGAGFLTADAALMSAYLHS